MGIETTQIHRVLQELQAGWLAGNGAQFAAPFVRKARFVAFDGTVLTGPPEIASFHQKAFESHLRGTALDIHLEEIRAIVPGVSLVFARGGITKTSGPAAERTGESVQVFVISQRDGSTVIEAFQNTRFRPVTDKQSAEAWRRPDALWNNRND